MVGAVVLVFSVMGGSSIGVVSNLMPVKSNLIFQAWRSGIVVIYFALPAVIELIMRRDEFKSR